MSTTQTDVTIEIEYTVTSRHSMALDLSSPRDLAVAREMAGDREGAMTAEQLVEAIDSKWGLTLDPDTDSVAQVLAGDQRSTWVTDKEVEIDEVRTHA